jgi:5'-3' exonuclease
MKESFIQQVNYDPVIQKALCGDISDRINGYEGIGPVKSTAMAKSSKDRAAFLERTGIQLFVRNMLLIDLSLCPGLLKNQLYVQRVLDTTPVFDKNELFDLARKYKVNGFVTEYNNLAAKFKQFVAQPEVNDVQNSKSGGKI